MLLSVPIRPRIPHRYTVDGCGCETEYVWINVWTWIRHISVIVVLCRKLSIKSGENEKNTYYSYTPTGGTRKHIFRKFLPWIIYVLWCCQAHCQESGPYRNSDSGLKIGVSFFSYTCHVNSVWKWHAHFNPNQIIARSAHPTQSIANALRHNQGTRHNLYLWQTDRGLIVYCTL